MIVSRDALQQFRAAIQINEHGEPFVWGEFEQLRHDIRLARALGEQLSDKLERLEYELGAVGNRLSDLRTCAGKLDWMHECRDNRELDPYTWMLFASSDVNAFLSNVRSLFDHLPAR